MGIGRLLVRCGLERLLGGDLKVVRFVGRLLGVD